MKQANNKKLILMLFAHRPVFPTPTLLNWRERQSVISRVEKNIYTFVISFIFLIQGTMQIAIPLENHLKMFPMNP